MHDRARQRHLVPDLSRAALAAVLVVLAACSGAEQTKLSLPALGPAALDQLLFVPGEVGMDPPGVFGRQKILAVALNIPHVRYRISTTLAAQVAAAPDGSKVYVLDIGDEAAPLRVFEAATGRELGRAPVVEPKNIVQSLDGHGAIVVDGRDRVLVLYAGGSTRQAVSWVEAYDPHTLRHLGTVAESDACGDLLLAAGSHIAVVCRRTGEVTITTEVAKARRRANIGSGSLADAALFSDGTLAFLTARGALGVLAAGETAARLLPGPLFAGARAIGAVDRSRVLVSAAEPAQLALVALADGSRFTLALASMPGPGVAIGWPYAYVVTDAGLEYVDLQSGREQVLPVAISPRAAPVVLAPR